MAIRRVFVDDEKESFLVVQEPGVIILTSPMFKFGGRTEDGRRIGMVVSQGDCVIDFGELGKVSVKDIKIDMLINEEKL